MKLESGNDCLMNNYNISQSSIEQQSESEDWYNGLVIDDPTASDAIARIIGLNLILCQKHPPFLPLAPLR